jgi:hypothetical protein
MLEVAIARATGFIPSRPWDAHMTIKDQDIDYHVFEQQMNEIFQKNHHQSNQRFQRRQNYIQRRYTEALYFKIECPVDFFWGEIYKIIKIKRILGIISINL